MMGLMRLLLVGAVGAGAAVLYKNRQAREAAMTLGQDVMDVAEDMLDLIPEKYTDKAKISLRRGGSTQMRPIDTGTGIGDPYTGPSQTNNPV